MERSIGLFCSKNEGQSEEMNNLLKKLEKPAFYLSLLFVFFVFLNFRDIPDRYVVLGAVVCCLFYFIKQRKLRMDISLLFLMFSIGLYEKWLGFPTVNWLMDVILVAAFMLFGKYLMLESQTESDYMISGAVFLGGYSLYGLLNCINYYFNKFELWGIRAWPDIWTGENVLATQHCLYIMPLLAMILPAIVCLKKYKVACSITIITGTFFLYHSLSTLSRTPIMAFAVLFVWEMLLFLILNRNNKKLMKITKWTVITGVVIFVLFLVLNWEWIQEIPFMQNMSKGGGVLNNVRFRAQRSVLMQMFDYPMGKPEMCTEGMKFVHNVWLDMAKKTGLIPFGLFSAYTVISFIQVVRLLRSNIKQEQKYLLSGIYLAFVLYYTVEPALDANIRYMIPWTFINGLIAGCNHKDFMKVEGIR